MSIAYRHGRKERHRGNVNRRWLENRRSLAMLGGGINVVAVALESFLQLGFFGRLWWVLTGRFDRSAGLRKAQKTPPDQVQGEEEGVQP